MDGSPGKIQKMYVCIFVFFSKSLNTFLKIQKSVYEKYKIHSLYFPRPPKKIFFAGLRPAALSKLVEIPCRIPRAIVLQGYSCLLPVAGRRPAKKIFLEVFFRGGKNLFRDFAKNT